jgi:hypothetical protein
VSVRTDKYVPREFTNGHHIRRLLELEHLLVYESALLMNDKERI